MTLSLIEQIQERANPEPDMRYGGDNAKVFGYALCGVCSGKGGTKHPSNGHWVRRSCDVCNGTGVAQTGVKS